MIGAVVFVKRNDRSEPERAVIVEHYESGFGPAGEPECFRLQLKTPWQYDLGYTIKMIYRRTNEITTAARP